MLPQTAPPSRGRWLRRMVTPEVRRVVRDTRIAPRLVGGAVALLDRTRCGVSSISVVRARDQRELGRVTQILPAAFEAARAGKLSGKGRAGAS